MTTQTQTEQALNVCLRTLNNAQEGFQTAATVASSKDLITILTRLGESRGRMATEVRSMITEIGGRPTSSASLSGKAHQGWMKIRSTLAGNSDVALLDECIRGEQFAVEALEGELQEDIPAHIKTSLHKILVSIKEDLELIQSAKA